jgi:TPR repeat protein
MKGDKLYKKALKAAEINNNKKAFELLNKSIAHGNPKALYAIGTWYLHGKYVDKDITKAIKYLFSSASAKNPDAFYDLAVCYEEGIGLEKNEDKAFEYYLQASLRGDKQSIYEIGRCYYYGIGVCEDRVLADYWLERAEELGINDEGERESILRVV